MLFLTLTLFPHKPTTPCLPRFRHQLWWISLALPPARSFASTCLVLTSPRLRNLHKSIRVPMTRRVTYGFLSPLSHRLEFCKRLYNLYAVCRRIKHTVNLSHSYCFYILKQRQNVGRNKKKKKNEKKRQAHFVHKQQAAPGPSGIHCALLPAWALLKSQPFSCSCFSAILWSSQTLLYYSFGSIVW